LGQDLEKNTGNLYLTSILDKFKDTFIRMLLNINI